MTRCRLLFHLYSDVRAGLEEHVLSLLQALPPDRFTLGLACPPALIAAMQTELNALPVEVFALPPVEWTQPRTLYQLWQILRQFRPDILHCHLFRAALVGAPVACAVGIPLVLETYHGRETWRQSGLVHSFIIDRWISRFVDHYISVSQAAARFLIDHKQIPAQKITVIPNGRDLSVFEPGQAVKRQAMRQHLQIPANTPVIGVVGRLEDQKGHRYLFDAMPQILADFPTTRLLLIGDGSLRNPLDAQARQLGIRDAIMFAGFQRDVPAYMAVADIMVLPSLHEGLPLTAIEAAAMGKPIVATDVDGTPEVIESHTSGLLVPPAAPAPLATAILTLLHQPDLAMQYGAAAHLRVQQRFDLKRQVSETTQLYINLLSTKKR